MTHASHASHSYSTLSREQIEDWRKVLGTKYGDLSASAQTADLGLRFALAQADIDTLCDMAIRSLAGPVSGHSDEDVFRRFQRWTLLLDRGEANRFWDDIEWLRRSPATASPEREE